MTRTTFARLCRARDRLREVHDSRVSIRDVAREAEASPYHFIRQFQSVFGRTPHQFRIESQIDRAKTLLASGDLSVTEVCMEVGFSSLGSFSTLFASRVGEPPSAFRRRLFAVGRAPDEYAAALHPGCLVLMWRLPTDAAIFEKPPLATL